MKVIDLLNKIANKEEIPLIKYNGRILHYDYLNEWFEDKRDNGYCKMEVYYEDLNDNVDIVEEPIVEEPKKINKIRIDYNSINIDKAFETGTTTFFIEKDIAIFQCLSSKINEIIDKINEVE